MISKRILKSFSLKYFKRDFKGTNTTFVNKTDVLIIGGGCMGSSTAYWLKQKSKNRNLNVTVMEKDPTYKHCSTSLSVGGLRQQFSLKENIQMSMFGAEFIKTLKERFGPDADVNFHPNGYLFLATKHGSKKLENNFKLQESLGARHWLLTKNELKERFPWLDVSEVELGCLGCETEGWFDPWSLLHLFRNGAINRGAQYITAEAVKFVIHEDTLSSVTVRLPTGELKTVEFSCCVLAAGAESGRVAKLANIGTGTGILSYALPVERRKRYVYSFNCRQKALSLNCPMVIDGSKAYFRREGNSYIAGRSPEETEEPSTENLEVDYSFFDEKVWPAIVKRVPAFEAIKVIGAWGGFYEYNTFDQNGIIGRHPYYDNLFIASGFSGHGIQQSPAVGRAISELILDGRYSSIDLTRLGFERLINNEPVREVGII